MRRTDDIGFLIDDLRSIKSSTETGGYFTQEYGFIKSFPQHLSYILDEHLLYLQDENSCIQNTDRSSYQDTGKKCPDCGAAIMRNGGCESCADGCGWSKCG